MVLVNGRPSGPSYELLSTHGNMAVYRVHWLKAKSRRDRWREEELLLTSEMEWTELFFRHRASRWKNLAAKSSAIALRTSHSNESEHPQGSRIFPKAET